MPTPNPRARSPACRSRQFDSRGVLSERKFPSGDGVAAFYAGRGRCIRRIRMTPRLLGVGRGLKDLVIGGAEFLKYLVVACTCAALLCVNSRAAETRMAAASLVAESSLDEVVVTATRSAQPASQALEPVVLIDRMALEDSLATDIGDVLRFHAGLDIGRSG